MAAEAFSIPDIRPFELLALWSELDDALNGQNGYGGDVAELYAYRFDVYSPVRHIPPGKPDWEPDAAAERAKRLYDLLRLFASQRNCRISIGGRNGARWIGRTLGRWLLSEPFDHRVHVRVRERS